MSGSEDIQLCYVKSVQAYHADRLDIALQFVENILKEYPKNGGALHLRGLISLSSNKPAEAEIWFARSVHADPNPIFYNSLCVAQTRLKLFSQAAASALSGLEVADDFHPDLDTSILFFNLGLALQLNDKLEDAIGNYRRTIDKHPGHSSAQNNMGTCLNALGELDLAINAFRLAIEGDPANLEAHSNLGHALLAAGRYDEAWPYFEHRWASFQGGDRPLGIKPPALPIRRWLGQAPLSGENRLLVFHEQGFGDTLQFCRYLPMVLARFTTVGFVCPRPLRRLLTYSLCSRWPNLQLL